jgi:hypothetical protein
VARVHSHVRLFGRWLLAGREAGVARRFNDRCEGSIVGEGDAAPTCGPGGDKGASIRGRSDLLESNRDPFVSPGSARIEPRPHCVPSHGIDLGYPMPNVLNYGRRRSRRHVFFMAAAVVIALVVGVVGVRRWRLHQAWLEDQRLLAEQRKYRADFDREFSRALAPTSNPAQATSPAR